MSYLVKAIGPILALLALSGCQETDRAGGAVSADLSQQCHKDTDCKGDRICDRGVCANPSINQSSVASSAEGADASKPQQAEKAESGETAGSVPKFADYPSGPKFKGPVAALADASDEFRTRNREALTENPIVFASEYVISTIGCGTGCRFQSFLSKRTGEQLSDGFGGEEGELIKEVRPDSRLVVTAGRSDADTQDEAYYAYFYVLEGKKLKRIAKVKTTLPECEGTDYCTVESPY